MSSFRGLPQSGRCPYAELLRLANQSSRTGLLARTYPPYLPRTAGGPQSSPWRMPIGALVEAAGGSGEWGRSQNDKVRRKVMIMSQSADVRTMVLNALHWDLAVPRDRVKVELENGWVTMSGMVDRPYQRTCAEFDARRAWSASTIKFGSRRQRRSKGRRLLARLSQLGRRAGGKGRGIKAGVGGRRSPLHGGMRLLSPWGRSGDSRRRLRRQGEAELPQEEFLVGVRSGLNHS